MNVEFPVFVRAKDCGEIRRYPSLGDLQKDVEAIDVENGEYFAWDTCGVPCRLGVTKAAGLELEPQPELRQPTLKESLEDWADELGWNGILPSSSAKDFHRAYDEIMVNEAGSRVGFFQRIRTWWKSNPR